MKAAALGRGKAKDAYDIYFLIKNYKGGVLELAQEFIGYKDKEIILNMKEKLNDKFASVNHAGLMDVVNFLDIMDGEEGEFIKRDVYEQVKDLVNNI